MALWLCAALIFRDFWTLLGDHRKTNRALVFEFLSRSVILLSVPAVLYISTFYVHLAVLTRTGPHDNVMTSAFQVSLEVSFRAMSETKDHLSNLLVRYCTLSLFLSKMILPYFQFVMWLWRWVFVQGGLAAITRRQPVQVAHGSQITLLHTHGQRCWLHSHDATYPILYGSKRGSSHQQQVTCYPHKVLSSLFSTSRFQCAT